MKRNLRGWETDGDRNREGESGTERGTNILILHLQLRYFSFQDLLDSEIRGE